MGQSGSVTTYMNQSSGSFRHCTRCESLCYMSLSSGVASSVCPAGGQHTLYTQMEFSIDQISQSPAPWAWKVCSRCSSFCYGNGVCSAGGYHQRVGCPDIILNPSPPSPYQQIPSWRLCRRCNILFLFRGTLPTGVCSAGGGHDPSPENFLLTSRQPVVKSMVVPQHPTTTYIVAPPPGGHCVQPVVVCDQGSLSHMSHSVSHTLNHINNDLFGHHHHHQSHHHHHHGGHHGHHGHRHHHS